MRCLVSTFPKLAVFAALIALGACATPTRTSHAPQDAHYKIGKPYKINGRWYHPKDDPDYEEVGTASWYGRDFHGRMTANGEIFDMALMSAAHTTLPLPSLVEVTNLKNKRKTIVRVNDRGPFAHNRIIDLSREAARELGFESEGLARVRVRYLGRAPLQAKAPSRGERVRYAGARPDSAMQSNAQPLTPTPAPAAPAAVVSASSTVVTDSGEQEAGDPSQLLTAIEAAPALTENAAAAIVAEAESENPGAVDIPATSITSRPAAGHITIVETSPGASPPEKVETLYLVRVASLSQLSNIDALKSKLEPIGPLAMTRVELDDARVFYRINMGPFASIETAAERLEAVRAAGYSDAAMVTLTP